MRSTPLQAISVYLFSLLFVFSLSFQSLAQDAAAPADAAPAAADAGGGADAALVGAGKSLFENNCTTCHSVTDEVVVGPGLYGVNERHTQPWLISWIRNSSKMVADGDPQAVELFNKYNKTQMPSYAFSDDEIKSILAYVKAEGKPAAAAAPAGGADATAAGGEGGAGTMDPKIAQYVDILLIILTVVLLVMVITLFIIANIMRNYLREKRELTAEEAELVNQRWDFSKIYKSGVVRTLVVLIFIVAILKVSLDAAFAIGIQQGYQPKQPIAFSHKLHAGDHQIDCNYCHSSVYKGKNAGIPSANICMNCHNTIKNVPGTTNESPEIKKIYTAIENNKPIEWVRIHNLPDLAYFNHAQHTNVGRVECQTCHGDIQEMDVVYQFAPLTMGWCVDCHRETPLNTQGNAYYDNLVQIHASESKKPFTVESNGGLECSKCHY